jgi:hypothetical protein
MCIKTSKTAQRRSAGLTFPEVLISMVIGMILILAVASFSLYSSRALAGLYNYVHLDESNRNALDRLTREMRQARGLQRYESDRLEFVDFDGTELVYQYSPSIKALVRMKDGEARPVLRNCDSFAFRLYRSNPVGGTYDQALTTNVFESKVVGMTWDTSRRVLGGIKSSEKMHSAKIVIRKGNS